MINGTILIRDHISEFTPGRKIHVYKDGVIEVGYTMRNYSYSHFIRMRYEPDGTSKKYELSE